MSRILLGVSGGIAAYKACDLCRKLRAAGHEVRVVMTENAEKFVTATSLQALSGQPVRSSLWDEAAEAAMGHIELARWAELILIAPATADVMACLAHGLANDLLTTLCLASQARLILAPAMNRHMWAHPATRANGQALLARGACMLGPAEGRQACGDIGAGRMLEPEQIVVAIGAPNGNKSLHDVRLVISDGPTFEDIDAVRFIGNRSSGRMGFAVAEAAHAAGASVELVAGPVNLETPFGMTRRTDVRSAKQMLAAMRASASHADIVLACAAVADYRLRSPTTSKLKKDAGNHSLNLALLENPDILAQLASLRPRPSLVGFAAETGNLESRARDKLERKNIDMIAANLVGNGLGFDTPDNALSVYWRDGGQVLPRAPKRELAQALVAVIAARYRLRVTDGGPS